MEKDGISFQPKLSTNKQIKVRTQVLCKDLRYYDLRLPYFFCFNFCFLLCKEYQCPPPHSIIIHKFFKSVRCTVTISYFFYHVFLCKLVNCVLKKNAFSCV